MPRKPVVISVAFKRPFSTYTYTGVHMNERLSSYGVIGDVAHLVTHELGATSLLLTTLTPQDEVEDIVRRADGVLISGGVSMIHPGRYGQTPAHDRQFFDEERDGLESAMLRTAIKHKIPALMICRGMQLLNVFCGGTLQQELPRGAIDHNCSLGAPRKDAGDRHTHGVIIEPGTHLARWTKNAQDLRINSIHDQAIDRLGRDLVVEARSPDGVIEAIRYTAADHFVYGTQWHPDYNPELPASRAVLNAYKEAISKNKPHWWRRLLER